MKIHISLNVSDLEKSVEFYGKMLNTKPAKFFPAGTSETRKGGYAKFDVSDPGLNLALNEVETSGAGSLSHLGIQLDTADAVKVVQQRWEAEGLIPREEMDVACCYAQQDKAWVSDPDGNEWEAFFVVGDIAPNAEQTGCCDPSETKLEDGSTSAACC